MNKILVIAPHCDDEILGCGATINKYFNLGHQITALILTNSHIGAPELYTKNKINLIRDQTLKAHKKIGINKTIFFDLPNFIKFQLKSNKIVKIDTINIDTFVKKNNFFSARRSLRLKHDDYGRNISIIMIN